MLLTNESYRKVLPVFINDYVYFLPVIETLLSVYTTIRK